MLGRHAHEIHAACQSGDVDAGRVVNHVHGVDQFAIHIVNLHVGDVEFVNADIDVFFCRIRIQGDAVLQPVLDAHVSGLGCDSRAPIADVAATAVSLHLDFVGGETRQASDVVAVGGGSSRTQLSAHRTPFRL